MSANSNALVATSGSENAFAQQGSLDWVALGRMQYSSSIAILARLAKAGIDTLTVAFGQGMCLRLPIGAHGEKVLATSMSKLSAKSFAADLLWFGVGVRHILRDLVQTSQGCSLVALCAALTEAHTINVSALILYEMAKECGGPQDIVPSVEQWVAFIRVTSPIFSETTMGLRIAQIARFGMADHERATLSPSNPHPSDLAKSLLSIGQIVQGTTQSVSILGDRCCSWIAAWADFVLGLKVLVRDGHDNIVYANYNPKDTSAQVYIKFLVDEDLGRVLCIQTTHVIRSGTEFIQKCFGRQNIFHKASCDLCFSPGRLQWDSMFSDTFGGYFEILTKRANGTTSPLFPFATYDSVEAEPRPFQTNLPGTFPSGPEFVLSEDQLFTRLLAVAIIITSTKESFEGRSASQYFLHASERIPELRSCSEQTLFAIENFLALYGPQELLLDTSAELAPQNLQALVREYGYYFNRLCARCDCKSHRHGDHWDWPQSPFCAPQIALSVIRLVSLLDKVVFDSPLKPTAYGLRQLYETARHQIGLQPASADELFRHIDHSAHSSFSDAFPTIAALVSAEEGDHHLSSVVAQSDGKIYCYTHLLEGLTDSLQEARKIHVGSGQIEHRTRLHRVLYDKNERLEPSFGYPAQRVQIVANIDHLQCDTSSSAMDAHLVVREEPVHLSLQHRIKTDLGDVFISPTSFLENLRRANIYKCHERLPQDAQTSWIPVLCGYQYVLVHGEGAVETPDNCHMLRPLRGNLLGRCVAISLTMGRMALVKTDEELELFARHWALRRDEWVKSSMPLQYYVLIS